MKRVKCREENPGDSWQEVYARFYQESVERRKWKISEAGLRTSGWLWIVDLFSDYDHCPVRLTRFLKHFIRLIIFTYGVVWGLKRKKKFFVVKNMPRENFKKRKSKREREREKKKIKKLLGFLGFQNLEKKEVFWPTL